MTCIKFPHMIFFFVYWTSSVFCKKISKKKKQSLIFMRPFVVPNTFAYNKYWIFLLLSLEKKKNSEYMMYQMQGYLAGLYQWRFYIIKRLHIWTKISVICNNNNNKKEKVIRFCNKKFICTITYEFTLSKILSELT